MSESINERICKVKGWQYVSCVGTDGFAEDGGLPPPYYNDEGSCPALRDWSGSIADAWTLRDELAEKGYDVIIASGDGNTAVVVNIHEAQKELPSGVADTAPEAICLAWLSVMERDYE